jgi:uncharacterized membrane protein YbaN (DUF454 family)
MATTRTNIRWTGVALWTIQGLLAALFLFAGAAKLMMPIEMLTEQTSLPGAFMQFISVCEMLGAIGLILPGVVKTHTGLTPLAAAGLVIIMIGAMVLSLAMLGVAAAILPFVVGLLCASVAYGRRPQLFRYAASRRLVLQPAS